MRIRTVAAAFALCALLFAGRVTAASFDCGKARTAHEVHICTSPTLSAADGLLGLAYKQAQADFPVRGFVTAVQRRFLVFYPSCDAHYGQSCAAMLDEQLAKLQSMRGATVYLDGDPRLPFDPQNGVFWLDSKRGRPTLHYFGSFMPDMNTREPFPNGFVCDDSIALDSTANGLAGSDGSNTVTVTDRAVSSEISCSPRNGLFGSVRRFR